MTHEEDYTEQPPLTPLSPQRLGPNLILGFRTSVATADADGVEIDIDSSFGMGGLSLSVTAKRGKERIAETLDLKPLINEWAQRVAKELADG